MAKPSGRPNKPKKPKKPRGRSLLDELAMADSDKELDDGFAAGEDRIAIQPGAAAGSDDEFDEQAVYDLDDSDDSDDDDEDDEDADEDSEDVLEAAIQKGGKAAQLAKQARYLEQKLKLQQGEDDDEEQGEDDDDNEGAAGGVRERLWGSNKRSYYQEQDTAAEDLSDDEAAQEEEEVRRLQAAQAAAATDDDYDLPGVTAAATRKQQQQQQQRGGGERSLEQLVAGGGAGGAGGVEVETVAKDIGSLTAEEQLAVVMSDAPELLALLEELKVCLSEVRSKVGPLLREVTSGGLATAAGLSYLEVKHLLLLQYCMCIVAYLMIKAEGKPVKDHPVIARMVQLRAYIEKIRPIDKQLAYQINKLLRATSVAQAAAAADAAAAAAADAADAGEDAAAAAAAAGGGDDDALRFRPNPAALMSKGPLLGDRETGLEEGGAAAAAAAGVYRPPKLNPVAMEDDRALSNKEMRRLREAQRKAQRSSVLREMAQELAGAPEEVTADMPGMDNSAAAVATRHRLEARAAAEEELMLRVPLSKTEAKKLKAQRRAGLSGAGLADFADDVADLVAAAAGSEQQQQQPRGGLAEQYGKQRLSQQYGADLAVQQSKLRSGDADIIPRKPLHERRAAFDAVAARRSAAAALGSDDDNDNDMPGYDRYDVNDGGGSGSGSSRKRRAAAAGGGGDGGGEEDEFYASAKAARAQVKAAKQAKHAAPQLAPPLPDPAAVGQRKISYEIEKNRGLTPHRRKDLKNPRKKHRVKFAQALVRRKGQVQSVKEAPSAPRGYAGEATGIKSKIAKSVRLG